MWLQKKRNQFRKLQSWYVSSNYKFRISVLQRMSQIACTVVTHARSSIECKKQKQKKLYALFLSRFLSRWQREMTRCVYNAAVDSTEPSVSYITSGCHFSLHSLLFSHKVSFETLMKLSIVWISCMCIQHFDCHRFIRLLNSVLKAPFLKARINIVL